MRSAASLSCMLFLAASTGHLAASGFEPVIFNLPTTQTAGAGVLDLEVGHRYLDVNRPTTNINISLSCGVFDRADIFSGYSFKNKDITGGAKVRVFDDRGPETDIVSLALLIGGGYRDTNGINNSLSLSSADRSNVESRSTLDASERASYFGQLVLQKHLYSGRIGIGLAPTCAYNTNFYGIESRYDYSAGCGAFLQVYVGDRVSLCAETVVNVFGFAFKYANYNAGVKYAGYRHTFSLWIGNSAGYSPAEYMVGSTETTPKLGFAFTREFDLRS